MNDPSQSYSAQTGVNTVSSQTFAEWKPEIYGENNNGAQSDKQQRYLVEGRRNCFVYVQQ